MAKKRKIIQKKGKKDSENRLVTERVLTNQSKDLQEALRKKTEHLIDKPEGYKPKILWVSESSVLGTGFSTYTNEILKRLYKTDEFEIAEMGSYVAPEDERLQVIPWQHYAVMPHIYKDPKTGRKVQKKAELDSYQSKNSNQFGEWRFEQVLLEFQPDIVIDNRDWWMVEFEERTKLRENFIWILLVPVDGDPQKHEWMATYERADIVLSYSEYGNRIIENQSAKKIKVHGVPSPGVDLNVFKPVTPEEKSALKKKYWMTKHDGSELKVIGTVMRNQGRKLFTSLIQSFRMYRDKHPESFDKTVLHLHTSIPDVGWDIRESLRRTGMLSHVTLTYRCEECNHIFVSNIMGDQSTDYYGVCQKCGKNKARTPNTQRFLSREQLAEIYNTFDVYVQFSISEGFGMPIVEAKACGVPVMVTKNTAMAEQGTGQGRGGGGFHINVVEDGYYIQNGKKIPFSTFTECLGQGSGTGMREWHLPSRKDIVDKWHKFFKLSSEQKQKLSQQARKCTEEYYDWDKCSLFWKELFGKIQIKDRDKCWNRPMKLLNPRNIRSLSDIPENLESAEFIKYLYREILLEEVEDEKEHQGFNDWMKALENGGDPQKIIDFFIVKVADVHNKNEHLMAGQDFKSLDKKLLLI